MNSGPIGCELAVLAVLCVLTIFLFPSVQGPYSVVNGPVTALQAARAAVRLRKGIIQAALRSLGYLLIVPVGFSWMSRAQAELHLGILPECAAVLRC